MGCPGEPSHQMEHGGPSQPIELRRQVLAVARSVGEGEGLALPVEARAIDGSLDENVEGRGDEELQPGDAREVAEGLGNRNRLELAKDDPQASVDLLNVFRLRQKPPRNFLELRARGESVGVDAQMGPEQFRQKRIEKSRLFWPLIAQREEIRSEYGSDGLLVHALKQPLPEALRHGNCPPPPKPRSSIQRSGSPFLWKSYSKRPLPSGANSAPLDPARDLS